MRHLSSVASAVLLVSCLPGDTRAPPGSVLLTAEPSAMVASGFSTADGWQVSFERLLVALGGVYLENNACTPYADAGYERLFDFAASQTQQKLSSVYGLGACSLRIGLSTPGADAPLGIGVTAADLALMRTLGQNLFGAPTGVKVFVRGRASKGAVTKRFAWAIREGFWLHDCPAEGALGLDPERVTDVTLHGSDAFQKALVIHGEELFRANQKDDAELLFDAIAAADTDADQEITLEELGNVPGPPPDVDAGLMIGDGGVPSLAAFIQWFLMPRMVRVGTSGPCLTDPRGRPR